LKNRQPGAMSQCRSKPDLYADPLSPGSRNPLE
jgi:hypothetical protein